MENVVDREVLLMTVNVDSQHGIHSLWLQLIFVKTSIYRQSKVIFNPDAISDTQLTVSQLCDFCL